MAKDSPCYLVERVEAGDIIFVLTGFEKGGVRVRVHRNGRELQWIHTRNGIQREGRFHGIWCHTELMRTLNAVANLSGCAGVTEHELPDEQKREGWSAFLVVQGFL